MIFSWVTEAKNHTSENQGEKKKVEIKRWKNFLDFKKKVNEHLKKKNLGLDQDGSVRVS